MTQEIIITAAEMQTTLQHILLKQGFAHERAVQCAEVFTANTVDGVSTHGINRFPRFIQYIKDGLIDINATPVLKSSFGGIEQWNGNLGPGILNALQATERVMQLAKEHGIGCLALANTNHWMRGGTYGWKAAKAGFAFIGWTNTIANLPAWNAADSRLGNNPLVMALPYDEEAIVLDMAMSQFSFGAMEQAQLKGEKLPVLGGYDINGQLTDDPTAIIQSKRPLPIGYWKGAGLALLLDVLAAVLSSGLSTQEISRQHSEHGVSQVFIAIDLSRLHHYSSIGSIIQDIIGHYHQSVPLHESKQITFPGEMVLQKRKQHLQNGIPVLAAIWQEVKGLYQPEGC